MYSNILGQRCGKCKERAGRNDRAHARCYTSTAMYARKLRAEMTIGAERRPVPLDWLDSFCMRNFTGSAEFDDTLPVAEGRVEASFRVTPERFAESFGAWLTQRGKGEGQPVLVHVT